MFVGVGVGVGGGVKRKMDNDMMSHSSDEARQGPKKPRLVFTDIQRRTLHAIFKETKRPSKEMQQTIAQQLGLEVTKRNDHDVDDFEKMCLLFVTFPYKFEYVHFKLGSWATS